MPAGGDHCARRQQACKFGLFLRLTGRRRKKADFAEN